VGPAQKGDDVMRYCVEAKKSRKRATRSTRSAGELFEKEKTRSSDEVEKVYDKLDRPGRAEDVANVIESITLKHA